LKPLTALAVKVIAVPSTTGELLGGGTTTSGGASVTVHSNCPLAALTPSLTVTFTL
jgi:hypothetical protein